MKTDCKPEQLEFQGLGTPIFQVKNTGAETSTDGGLILLHSAERKLQIIKKLSSCFSDSRKASSVQHNLHDLLMQRIFGLAQGYEDLNDHDQWRNDPLLRSLFGKGENSAAGKSTLNRLELGMKTQNDGNRYKKISWDNQKIEDLLVDIFLDQLKQKPDHLILDFDATDDPLHGNQEGRFFNGFYDSYCYMPLYCFCGSWPLAARLRTSDGDAARDTVEILARLVEKIRQKHPKIPIILRADSGFMRAQIMNWCEIHKVFYVLGMSRNKRLVSCIETEMEEARKMQEKSGKSARVFTHIAYMTKSSWSRARRVIAKAEQLEGKANPRFVVTNLPAEKWPPKELYEELYCGRGDMENRIKEQQLYLFADRTSTALIISNQLRLWLSTFAYIYFVYLRETGLLETDWTNKQASTLRLSLLKVSAVVKVTCRAIKVTVPRAFPYWELWKKLSETLKVA